jgi:tetratricopeptide (TPR) repeat protein
MDPFKGLRLDEMFFEADALIAEKKVVDAVSLLEGILNEDPSYGKAYNHLGWIYETKYKDYTKAEHFYRKCLEYTPDYPAVYINISVVLSHLGKWEDLDKILGSALKVPGVDKGTIYNEFGIMNELQGKFQNAVDFYKMAIKISLADANIETYFASIKRCNRKQEMLG